MCGRYALGADFAAGELREIIEAAAAAPTPGLRLTMRADGDVYPTDVTYALLGRGGESRAVAMRWGFRTARGLVINARAETAFEKLLFRESARERRCLLPALGYYEWNARKERFFFRRPGGGLLYLAGLYRTGADGQPEYVILTREADDEARAVHARMPVIISSPADWLFDRAAAQEILASGGAARLEIERQSPEQLSMFDI
jgi:putative SOS response-associated peptidase YedK